MGKKKKEWFVEATIDGEMFYGKFLGEAPTGELRIKVSDSFKIAAIYPQEKRLFGLIDDWADWPEYVRICTSSEYRGRVLCAKKENCHCSCQLNASEKYLKVISEYRRTMNKHKKVEHMEKIFNREEMHKLFGVPAEC